MLACDWGAQHALGDCYGHVLASSAGEVEGPRLLAIGERCMLLEPVMATSWPHLGYMGSKPRPRWGQDKAKMGQDRAREAKL